MNRRELTKTFMMISNWKKPFSLHDLCKPNCQRFILNVEPASQTVSNIKPALVKCLVFAWQGVVFQKTSFRKRVFDLSTPLKLSKE